MQISNVIKDLFERCQVDEVELRSFIETMIDHRWSDHDLNMHVACRMPLGTSFSSNEDRRRAVMQHLVSECMADEDVLRVVVATEVACWTDDEVQDYQGMQAVSAPAPDMN